MGCLVRCAAFPRCKVYARLIEVAGINFCAQRGRREQLFDSLERFFAHKREEPCAGHLARKVEPPATVRCG